MNWCADLRLLRFMTAQRHRACSPGLSNCFVKADVNTSALLQADVRNAIEELPAAYREVIVLREFEELSYHEIAQVLDCPCGTVMSRLKRARERLKALLQDWSLATSEAARAAGR